MRVLLIAILVLLAFKSSGQLDRSIIVASKPQQRSYTNNAATGGGAFSPPQSANLTLWLKPESLSALSNDDQVATWSDSSGSGHDMAQATAGFKPIYKTSVLNSLAAVRFDGSDDRLDSSAATSTFIAAGAFTIFIVAVPSSVDSAGVVYDNNTLIGDDAGYFGVTLQDDTNWRLWNFDGSVDATGSSSTLAAHIYEARHESGNIYASTDGNTPSSTASGNTTTLTTLLRVGNNYNIGATGGFIGDIVEVLVWNVALSSGDLDTVRDYLAARTGISVP